jgi:NTP pyrophosphatase (non-canonical NTP hydrolase)
MLLQQYYFNAQWLSMWGEIMPTLPDGLPEQPIDVRDITFIETTPIQKFYNAYMEYLPFKNPKRVFKCLGKITEELGEVAEACLAFDGNTKKTDKIAGEGQTPEERLAEEIMDTITCCFNLANAAKIDTDMMLVACVEKLNEKTRDRRTKAEAKARITEVKAEAQKDLPL